MEKTKWSENVILVDADYVDAVAFNLIVNFERMLNRPIPKADLAQWLVCAALDGGVGEGKNDIQVVFIHGKGRKALDNFTPSDFVRSVTGVDNVCERAAVLGGGRLRLRKRPGGGVTVAAAVGPFAARFAD